jgi:hypothetical protein
VRSGLRWSNLQGHKTLNNLDRKYTEASCVNAVEKGTTDHVCQDQARHTHRASDRFFRLRDSLSAKQRGPLWTAGQQGGPAFDAQDSVRNGVCAVQRVRFRGALFAAGPSAPVCEQQHCKKKRPT